VVRELTAHHGAIGIAANLIDSRLDALFRIAYADVDPVRNCTISGPASQHMPQITSYFRVFRQSHGSGG